MIKKEYTHPKQILFNVQNQVSVGVIVSATGVAPNADGKKIVKAGTPVGGTTKSALLNRSEPVTDKAVAAIKSTLKTGSTTSEILWTAKVAGAAGDEIKIVLVDPAEETATTTVSVTGKVITVTLKDPTGLEVTATAKEVVAAVKAKAEAAALVDVAVTGTGEGVVAEKAETALADGADATMVDGVEGVLLHDVDVTLGDANGTMLIWGFVNLKRLDPEVEISAAAVAALANKIIFLND